MLLSARACRDVVPQKGAVAKGADVPRDAGVGPQGEAARGATALAGGQALLGRVRAACRRATAYLIRPGPAKTYSSRPPTTFPRAPMTAKAPPSASPGRGHARRAAQPGQHLLRQRGAAVPVLHPLATHRHLHRGAGGGGPRHPAPAAGPVPADAVRAAAVGGHGGAGQDVGPQPRRSAGTAAQGD